MAQILSGKEVAAAITQDTRRKADAMRAAGYPAALRIIRVGSSRSDLAYENSVRKRSEAAGVDVSVEALAEQAAYAVPQGQIPSGYWDLASGLVREIMNGDLGGASDETLMQRLQQFEDDIRGLVDP